MIVRRAPEPLPGAGEAEDFLSDDQYERLNFYRRLAGAFASVEGRAAGGGGQ
jgi:hypothetical protein